MNQDISCPRYRCRKKEGLTSSSSVGIVVADILLFLERDQNDIPSRYGLQAVRFSEWEKWMVGL